MGRRKDPQPSMWVAYNEICSAPGHRFYEKLNELLREAGFDRKAEALCALYYESSNTPGRRSVPPGVYFRMHVVGFFEGIESERGLEWRFADSLSLRQFLGIPMTKRVPDHSTLSRIRQRLPLEVHQEAFALILSLVESKGLLKGRVVGVDSTYLRADASMKAIVRRDTKESYSEFIKRLAQEAGIENPTQEEARRLDRARKGKKTSNKDWASKTDEEARIAKLKDGRTRLAYKPEHVVDLETGAIVAAVVHPADCSDAESIEISMGKAEENLQKTQTEKADRKGKEDRDEDPGSGPSRRAPRRVRRRLLRKLIADKGYNKAALLKRLKDKGYRTYIPERKQAGYRCWTDKGGQQTAAAFYENRARCGRKLGKRYQRWRSERVERTFAHVCETGAARRTRLRGRANVEKRYLLQAAAANLALVMRALFGLGTPRGWANRARRPIFGPILGVLTVVHHWIVSIESWCRCLGRSDARTRNSESGCSFPSDRLVAYLGSA
jgi:transposase